MNQITQRLKKFNLLDNTNELIFLLSNEDASVCLYISDMKELRRPNMILFHVLYLNLIKLYFFFILSSMLTLKSFHSVDML